MSNRLSIIIPALDEAAVIGATLDTLTPLRERGHELILVDGGSRDMTCERAASQVDVLMQSPPGRAVQMNAGARRARHGVLWFLHADTRIPPDADRLILQSLALGYSWGRFDVQLSGRHPLLRVVERMMNLRSRWSGIATGDQGLFMTRDAFETVGGFPEIPLMEDIAISRLLKHGIGRPLCLRERLITSSRRWEQRGILRTIALMWRLRLAYFLGADPTDLARRYR